MYTIKELDMDYPNLTKQEQADIVLDWLENGDEASTNEYLDYFKESIVLNASQKN